MLDTYRYFAGKFPVPFQTLKLSGSDLHEFLQNQSTFNFSLLNPGAFHLISFLDPHGKVEFYCWSLRNEDHVILLIPLLLKDKGRERLEKFLISEDVLIEDMGEERWTFIVGPKRNEYAPKSAYQGVVLEEEAILFCGDHESDLTIITEKELKTWQALNGWPSFDGSDVRHELINNLRLYDLSVSQNKGCYPGQETVAKIATRRGAAYSPVLIEVKEKQGPGILTNLEKKIGTAFSCHEWQGKNYLSAELLRDFRVENLNLNFILNGNSINGKVKYYPLLSGNKKEKAEELFYSAMEHFKKDNFEAAEESLKLAIELNPIYADAYESLGVMLGRLDRYPEAIELMKQLSAVDPSSVLAHTNMSLFLMKLGKIEEAEEQKSMATIKSFQKFGEEAKTKELLENQKKLQEDEWLKRESMFKQVLEIDDEDTLANYGLGSIAVEREEWDQAIIHLEKVLKADPQYSVAYLALGMAYKGSGNLQKAKAIWEEGVKVAAKKGDLMPANQMQSELSQF